MMRGMEIEAKNLIVEYGLGADRQRALDGVSLRVAPGEVVALLGPNGAGKSTLLRVLALLQPPLRGEVYLDGVAVLTLGQAEQGRLRRRMGLVPDTPFVFNLLTGREMLQYVGELYGQERKTLTPRIEELLARFGLQESADCFLRSYSQGMLKKLSLAAALILEGDALLLDEPTNSLDPEAVVTLREVLAEQRAAGAAILVSTHLLDLAERLADRVMVLQQGRVVHQETLAPSRRPEMSTLERVYREAMAP